MKRHPILFSLALVGVLTLQPLHAAEKEDRVVSPRGEGMVIAVLDSGFYLEHEIFALTTDTLALRQEDVTALLPSLTIESDVSCYVSEKIPFAYDYADHDADVFASSDRGTAMLSLAAGNSAMIQNSSEAMNGTAPEAQLLAMKIASDSTGEIDGDGVVCAIQDAVTLGADVILIGLSEPCGFGFDEESEIDEAIRAAHEAGVIVVAAAGDIGKYGSESIYDDEAAISAVTTDSPDVGTISFPASVAEVFTVGSNSSNVIVSDSILLPDGTQLPYSDSNALYSQSTGYSTFADYFSGQSFEYVVTSGIGRPEELAKAGNLSGKFAVIERGTLTFSEKAANAAACGAVGVIIVDNQPDAFSALQMRMDLSEAPIPAILISGVSGDILKASEDKQFTIGDAVTTTIRETPTPSSFSSRGVTPEILLKPDVTVCGESLRCANARGEYSTITSTSAAAASASGMLACVKQQVQAENPTLTAAEISARTQALFTSSATLMQRSTANTTYSPRIQGGGAAVVDAARNASLLLTANGSHKLSLGNRLNRIISLSVTAENLGDTERQCTLDVIVGSDGIDSFTFEQLDVPDENEQKPTLYQRLGKLPSDEIAFSAAFTPFSDATVTYATAFGQLNAFSDSYAPLTITLPPHSSKVVHLTFSISPSEWKRYQQYFENGFFVEGFVRLYDETETASLPFTGYIGDFYAADALDADLYHGTSAIYEGIWLYREISDLNLTQRELILGSDPFSAMTKNTVLDSNALYFSPTADPERAMLYLNLGLRRNITDVTLTVTDSAGEVVHQREFGNLARTYVSSTTGMLTSAVLPIWDGSADDYPLYLYPDGEYTLTLSYRKAKGTSLQEFSYRLILDSTPPVIEELEFFTNGEQSYLRVTASDAFAVEQLLVSDSYGSVAYEEESGVFNLCDIEAPYLYVEVYDKAMNHTIVRLSNPEYQAAA